MFAKVRPILKDVVFLGTLIVTIGSFAGAFFSYLLQFILARYLSVQDYGTFNALLSLFYIVGVPATVLSTSLIKLISRLKSADAFDKITQLFWNLSVVSIVAGIGFTLLFYFGRFRFSQYLNISQSGLFILYGVYVGFGFLITIPASLLQGLLRFKAFALFTITSSFLRFALPLIAILIGYKVGGVFFGMTLGSLLSYFISVLLLKKNFTTYEKQSLGTYYKQLLVFSAPVLFMNMGMMVLNNIDVILVKKFFAESTAGYYAGVVTAGKVLLFGASTVVISMYPQMSEAFYAKRNIFAIFRKYLALQLLTVIAGVAVFSLFPELILGILFPKFLPVADLLPKFSVFMGLYVMINFLIMFFLAVEKTKIYVLQIAAAVLQFILLNTYHKSLLEVINVDILVAALLLVALSIYGYVSFNNSSGVQAGTNNLR